MYKILKMEGRAKRAHMETVHGNIETPVFMNVGTAAAIKGAVSTEDLQQIGTQVELSNTYHLHVRPGDEVVKKMGGLHKFMVWDKPILTDSGGFQVFSLAGLRKIKEEGVYFHSHVDGRKIFMGPEESMQIQSNLASTIAMAFDECPSSVADRRYVQNSVDRTARWLQRCKDKMQELNQREDTINKHQLLFGINQGAIYEDIRIDHAKRISEMDLDGYAVGGLAVGETHEEMYHILDEVVPYLPKEKPTYLMGVGTPANILEGVERGVDFFDCVYPSRNGRHGHVYTNHGKMTVKLFDNLAPKTVKNFIELSKEGYYDGVIFHRIIKDFMVQGGDPTGTGMGGSSIYGEKFEDEFSMDLFNLRGALSMANAGPNTNGSQFFIVQNKNLPYPKDSLIQGGWPEEVAETYTGGGTPHLDGRHTVFGQLVDEESYKVLDEIAAVRVGAQDKPVDDVVIESVEIIEP